jgi:hypothetical protein
MFGASSPELSPAKKYEPLIVGGGPVGLFLAIQLARELKVSKVTLVDDRVDQYTRSGTLNTETLKEIDRLLQRLADNYPMSLALCRPTLPVPLQGKELWQYEALQAKVVAYQAGKKVSPEVVLNLH